ncbi:hypothetical protein C7999DRAFT_34190 [Corynascus novoguineensis]|uniref:Uncharacterized protein n=1 Tax=Corynascus novoguineensis TaxID=1126955 RepID=A0AAN7CQ96_9PEZI|nr:hypothetical protein C7999DRAFT_34190 [Corynascus novoguineensis]
MLAFSEYAAASLADSAAESLYLTLGFQIAARRDGYPNTHYLDSRKESPGIVSAFDPLPTRNFAGLLQSCPTAIASLTSLKIVLNECLCHHPVDFRDYPPLCCYDDVEHEPYPNGIRARCAQYHGSKHRRPLLDPVLSGPDSTSSMLVAQALLTSWYDATVHLSSYVRPGRLALSLVCDINHQHEYTLEAGQLAIAPLALLPPLKDCHIRLYKRWDRALQWLAESTALQACPKPSPLRLIPAKAPSALVNLPRELRLLILEYTDLVTPRKEVTWCRRYRRYYQKPRDPETASIEESYPYERLATSHFLREFVPANCLAHLRFLELVFPPYWPHSWPVDDHPAIVDWRDTVNWLRGKIDAPALTIRVVFADFLQNPAGSRSGTTKDEGKQIVRGYIHVI